MKRLMILICMMLSGGQALAVGNCQTDTIVTASTPNTDFTVNGNGTVTHHKTGLMWKQCSEGLSGSDCTTGAVSTYSWQAALLHVKTFNDDGGFAGYNDWRLPNIKELNSIREIQCISPAINATIFPQTTGQLGIEYWSATPYASNASEAWTVFFSTGSGNAEPKSSMYYVRLVRGGQ